MSILPSTRGPVASHISTEPDFRRIGRTLDRIIDISLGDLRAHAPFAEVTEESLSGSLNTMVNALYFGRVPAGEVSWAGFTMTPDGFGGINLTYRFRWVPRESN